MSWFELLKMIPLDNFTLGYVITNAKETEKAIKEIEKSKQIGSMYTIRTVLPHKDDTDERRTIVTKQNKDNI